MITLTAQSRTVVAHQPVGPSAAACRPGAAPVAPRCQGAGDGSSRCHRPGGRRRRASGLPSGDHAAAVPGRHPGRPQSGCHGRGSGRRADLRTGRRGRRSPTASTCTPRCTRTHPPTTASGSTPRSWFRPQASWWPAPASCTSRSPPATTRTPTSEPDPPDGDPYPVYEPDGLGARIGMPTCWDEWFPEVARNYSLGGAEIVVYPTAIGSEPSSPRSTPSRCGSR